MASRISTIIEPRSFELIRDRIAQILVDEIQNQGAINYDDDLSAINSVYVSRNTAYQQSEGTVVNVAFVECDYENHSINKTVGVYQFHIEVTTSNATSGGVDGYTNAEVKLHKILGVSHAILSNAAYVKLAFTSAFIEHRSVSKMQIGQSRDNQDMTSTVFGRFILTVRAVETTDLPTATLIAGYDTTARVGQTDKGWVWSTDQNIINTDTNQVTISINTETYRLYDPGTLDDIPVTDTYGNPIGTVTAGEGVVVGDVIVRLQGQYYANVLAEGEIDVISSCEDATVTVKNSAGTTIDSATIASGGSTILTITDSTAVIKNSAGTTLQAEAIPAEVSEDITIADTDVSNSDDSYTSVVVSGVAKELPDITYVDALGVSASYPSVKNLTATRVNAMTCGNLNGELTDAQRQVIQRVNPLKTGQTTSYRTGDDGDLEKGRLPTFTTLTCDNPFGNTNRFTDELGGQTYTNNLVCDWATGLMWYRVLSAAVVWNTAIDNAEASTQASYTDWRIPNMTEMISICNNGVTGGLDYSPFSLAAPATIQAIWTSSTASGSTSYAHCWIYGYTANQYKGILEPILKTDATRVKYYLCRNFTLSDLGL